MSRPRAAGTA